MLGKRPSTCSHGRPKKGPIMPASASSYQVRVPENPSAGPLRRPVRLLSGDCLALHWPLGLFRPPLRHLFALPFYLSCLSCEPAIRSPRHIFLRSLHRLAIFQTSVFTAFCLVATGGLYFPLLPFDVEVHRRTPHLKDFTSSDYFNTRPAPRRPLCARIAHRTSQSWMSDELVCATDTGR